MFELVFYHPEIPPNTGNAMRLAAVTGCRLHLIEPLGFTLDDAKLRRAGMDYRDRATVTVHPDLDACAAALSDRRVFAFTVDARTLYTDFAYLTGDVFLFGPESVGLPDEAQRHPWVTERVRIPMVAGVRSLNLSNAAAVAVYEAWRQHGFAGAVGSGKSEVGRPSEAGEAEADAIL
ncbi:MAG TPA: tRNA (cytidine(34)-2'-O)-methyltransferase [Acidimicrobiia bacterium]|nr:tRNA (cytidine(34)-2'-O)-methyltransferase [Acidimicrobiia bacterium]